MVKKVLLELAEHLPHRRFMTYFDALDAVITDNTAPERVVKVENERLFVLAQQRLYDIRKIERELRNGIQIQNIFIHVPHKRICPF